MQEKIPEPQGDKVSGATLRLQAPRPSLLSPSLRLQRGRDVALVSCALKPCVFFLGNFKKQAGGASVKSALMK